MAKPKPLRRVQTTDKDFNALQDNLKEFLDALLKNPVLGAITLPAITLQTGDNAVPHGLGRNWVYAFAAIPTAAVSLSLTATQIDRSTYVNVTASAPCTLAMLVM